MAQDKKRAEQPQAESVDREPNAEPTREGHDLPPVSREDAPKGQPTSDRFQTERAHRQSEKNAPKP